MTTWRADIGWGTPLTDAEIDAGHGCRKLHEGCMCRVGFPLEHQCGLCRGVNAVDDDGRRHDRDECQTICGPADTSADVHRQIDELAAALRPGLMRNGWRYDGTRWWRR